MSLSRPPAATKSLRDDLQHPATHGVEPTQERANHEAQHQKQSHHWRPEQESKASAPTRIVTEHANASLEHPHRTCRIVTLDEVLARLRSSSATPCKFNLNSSKLTTPRRTNADQYHPKAQATRNRCATRGTTVTKPPKKTHHQRSINSQHCFPNGPQRKVMETNYPRIPTRRNQIPQPGISVKMINPIHYNG